MADQPHSTLPIVDFTAEESRAIVRVSPNESLCHMCIWLFRILIPHYTHEIPPATEQSWLFTNVWFQFRERIADVLHHEHDDLDLLKWIQGGLHALALSKKSPHNHLPSSAVGGMGVGGSTRQHLLRHEALCETETRTRRERVNANGAPFGKWKMNCERGRGRDFGVARPSLARGLKNGTGPFAGRHPCRPGYTERVLWCVLHGVVFVVAFQWQWLHQMEFLSATPSFSKPQRKTRLVSPEHNRPNVC